jgi:squalene monooxygenase
MRQACFDYLRLGGIYAQGPISLLSGLNPRPFILVAHFFMVALYGVRPDAREAARQLQLTSACHFQVGRLLLPVPTPRSIFMGMRLLLGASAIILPIIRAEGLRAVFFPALVPGPPTPRASAVKRK